jgi:exodeoxyribonuclease V alpha subunit
VIEQTPERLLEVPGLGPKRHAMIQAAWQEQQAIKQVMLFLQDVGVSTSLGVRIYKTYGDAAISVVRTQPYRLASEVWGIGFKLPTRSPSSSASRPTARSGSRLGCRSRCRRQARTGHCYLPRADLLGRAAELLGVDAELARCA